jgi:hypothetical protein
MAARLPNCSRSTSNEMWRGPSTSGSFIRSKVGRFTCWIHPAAAFFRRNNKQRYRDVGLHGEQVAHPQQVGVDVAAAFRRRSTVGERSCGRHRRCSTASRSPAADPADRAEDLRLRVEPQARRATHAALRAVPEPAAPALNTSSLGFSPSRPHKSAGAAPPRNRPRCATRRALPNHLRLRSCVAEPAEDRSRPGRHGPVALRRLHRPRTPCLPGGGEERLATRGPPPRSPAGRGHRP